jgi:hypothetical protein
MEVFPAPRKPVKTVIGMVEGASELEGMIKCNVARAGVTVTAMEVHLMFRGLLTDN